LLNGRKHSLPEPRETAKKKIRQVLEELGEVKRAVIVVDMIDNYSEPHKLIRYGDVKQQNNHGERKKPLNYAEKISRGASQVVTMAANDLSRIGYLVQEKVGRVITYRKKGNGRAQEDKR
jgi:hypothetical protein